MVSTKRLLQKFMQPPSGRVYAMNAVVSENLAVARFTRVVIPAADPKRRVGVGAPYKELCGRALRQAPSHVSLKRG
jgi:hypothetical protein